MSKDYITEFNQWYMGYNSSRLNFGSSEAIEFVQSGVGIFSQIVDSVYRHYPRVVITDKIQTAGVDILRNTMYLPLIHIQEQQNPDVGIQQILLFYNGQVMHESSHLEHTLIPFEKLSVHVPEFNEKNQLMVQILQIVEDLFIDEQSMNKLPRFQIFYDARFDYLFSEEEMSKRCGSLQPTLDSKEAIVAWANTIPMLKNPANRGVFSDFEYFEYFAKLESRLLESLNLFDQLDRTKLAVSIYEELIKDLPEDEKFDGACDNPGGSSKDSDEGNEGDSNKGDEGEDDSANSGGNDSEGEGEENGGDSFGEALRELLEKIAEILEEGAESAVLETGEFEEFESGQQLPAEMRVELTDDESEAPDIFQFELSYQTMTSFFDSFSLAGAAHDKMYQMSEAWVLLTGLMQARSETQRYNGFQQKRGTRIRQLHRIATDSKIFSSQVIMQGLGPQEIIILVDLSGSMSSDNRYIKALNEAWGMAVALEAGHHRVAIYGHTADSLMDPGMVTTSCSNAIVYCIKKFEEATPVIEKRLHLINRSILRNNADGYAIKATSENFSSLQNNKTLIVISDGDPAANCYSSYSDGQNHTKEEVDKLRSKNINVFSVSIADECVKSNDIIYGKEYNKACTDINIVETLIERILQVR